MKDSSNKGIIPADALPDWQRWVPDELQGDQQPASAATPSFSGLSAAQAEALSASLAASEGRLPVKPLPEPDLNMTAPAQQLGYPTAAELESIHQEAWQAGHDAGFAAGETEGREQGHAQGHAAGLAEVQQRFADAWAPLERLTTSFTEALTTLEAALADDLLALAVQLAERLAAAHLSVDARAIEPLLHEALAALPETLAQGRLRVNPQDLEVARGFLTQERPETLWQWIEDPLVPRGGCLLETPSLRQDLTLPTRLAAMSRALGVAQETDGRLEKP